jgi:uncharacterized protein YerC
MARKTKWAREFIREEFKRLMVEGATYNDIRKKHTGLMNAICTKVDGGFHTLCEETGIDVYSILSSTAINRYKAENTSKEEVDNAIKEYYRNNKIAPKLCDFEASNNTSWIVAGYKRFYKDWKSALEFNGLTPTKFQYDKLTDLYKSGLSYSEISKITGLSSTRIGEVVKSAGFSREPFVNEVFDKEETLELVKELIAKSSSQQVTTYSIKGSNIKLYHSIKKHYKSLAKAVITTGEYVLDKNISRSWSKDFLIKQIRLGFENSKPLNSEYITKGNGKGAEAYARKVYGTWRNAIEAAGISYLDVRGDVKQSSYYGYKFEKVLGFILRELGVPLSKSKHERYKPDFVSGDTWIDAKLSQYTYRSNHTDKKYEPHCTELILIFLIGDRNADVKISEKTRLVSVYHILKMLPTDRAKRYAGVLAKIEGRVLGIRTAQDAV